MERWVIQAARLPPPICTYERLPKKAFYTSGEVAEILGVTWESLRHAIELGRVADCKERDGQGHRRWTEAEVERVVAECEGSGDQRPSPDADDGP